MWKTARGSHSLEVVVDAYLVLPQAVISRLGLRFSGRRSVTIASVAQITVDAYAGIVSSHERRHNGIVLESSSESLIGMSLLSGSRVILDVRADGSVLIEDAG